MGYRASRLLLICAKLWMIPSSSTSIGDMSSQVVPVCYSAESLAIALRHPFASMRLCLDTYTFLGKVGLYWGFTGLADLPIGCMEIRLQGLDDVKLQLLSERNSSQDISLYCIGTVYEDAVTHET